ncbi:ankyrin repeat domain-containing protein 36A [Periophthalmus magnuspinnatus]|uniref:ankyrin repeat domain-containing protein 36A n=1 Tax=Periophthalmus magnuspinnatus TaxID=409849 RepID=UPI00145A8BC4|nr:ankyrin repeat domain-containing protein 36A [Periophthalmus magnuspinnatus]
MDGNYPALKRPKKKLIYPTTKTCLPNQWTQDIVSLEDVDKMFDGLDSNGGDFPSPSLEIHIPKHIDITVTPLPEELFECPIVANGENKSLTPVSPELDIDSETPFKAHGPVKTSSPIEGNAIQHKNKQQRKVDNSASPILFDCAEENQETVEKLSEKPQHCNRRKNESDDSIFETLPKKSAFDDMSAQKTKTAPVRLTPSSPLVSPVGLEATPASPEKQTEHVQVHTRVKHDMTSFLQKLRDAGQPKPARAGLLQAKVMPPVPEPEPEDDFLILEDDAPLYVSIPSKSAKSLKEKHIKTSSSDKETKDTVGEEHTTGKLQGVEQDQNKQGSQALTKKTKKKTKGNVSESTLAAFDKDSNVPAIVESSDAENLLDCGKTKKKKIQKIKGPSKNDNNPECVGKGTDTDDGKPLKKNKSKGEKTVEKKGSKPANNNGNSQRKRTPANESRKRANKARSDGWEKQSQGLNCDSQPSDEFPVSEVNNLEVKSTGDLEDVNLHPHILCSSMEGTSDEGDRVLVKRKRKQTGQWWMSCPQNPQQQPTDKQPTVKKTKRVNKDSSARCVPPGKAATDTRKKNMKASSSSSSDGQRQKAEKKEFKKGTLKRARPVKRTSEDSDEGFQKLSQDRALDQDSESSPLFFPHKERMSSGEQVFPKVYQNGASEKQSSIPEGLLKPQSEEATKRRRKSPGNWWQVSPTAEDQEMPPSQPQQQKPRKRKAAGEKRKLTKNPSALSPSNPLEGATKQKKRYLATYTDLCSTVNVSTSINRKTESKLKEHNNVKSPSAEDLEVAHNVVTMETNDSQRAQDQSSSQSMIQESTSKVIRSGPSSMIGLENFEEDDEDIVLPSSTVQPALCASDLCSPPLRPLSLQSKDKVNLQDWLKSLWPITDLKQRGPEITPDDFEWYCYQGRALGIMVDLQSGSLCSGKMLLGSFMKKPLWVDHIATTVFNLLTSSVSLIVDCNKSYYSAGQSFMVPSGHAYSIHNLTTQPAVFYFTRLYAEESDQ